MVELSLPVVSDWLKEYLNRVSSQVREDAKEGLTNIHKRLEPVIRDLMNTLYQWNLVQEGEVNAGGFDLCDTKNQVLVQVTGNCTNMKKKIEDCLEVTANRIKRNPKLAGAKLYIVFLTMESDNVRNLRDSTKTKLDKGTLTANGFEFDAQSEILCLQDFDQFLVNNRSPNGQSLEAPQIRAIQKLLEVYDPTSVASVPQINLPLPKSLAAHVFFGREQELENLRQAVEDNVNPIVIWGLGGQGKTELAIRFGSQHQNNEHNVYWVAFEKNLRETVIKEIAAGIPKLLECGLGPDAIFDEVMKRLNQCPRNDCLIIDNVDWENSVTTDPRRDQHDVYDMLSELPMHLILTSRTEPLEGGIEIKRMDNEVLYQIFDRHKVEIEQQDKDVLIDAVEGHTMMVDLIARTLQVGYYDDVTPKVILNALKKNTLTRADFPPVSTNYNRVMTEQEIGAHIGTLFSLRGNTEIGEYILKCAILLPQDGMKLELFRNALKLPGKNFGREMLKLEKRGWLRRKAGRISIHPVVRMVCRDRLQPTEESCDKFLESLWEQRQQLARNEILQVVACFQNAFDLPGETAIWKDRFEILLNETLGSFAGHIEGSVQSLMTNDDAFTKKWLSKGNQDVANSYSDKINIELQYSRQQDICNQDSHEMSIKEQKMRIEQLRLILIEHPDDPNVGLVREILSGLEEGGRTAEKELVYKSEIQFKQVRSRPNLSPRNLLD